MARRVQYVTLRVEYDPAEHDEPGTWTWSAGIPADPGITLVSAEPVLPDPASALRGGWALVA